MLILMALRMQGSFN